MIGSKLAALRSRTFTKIGAFRFFSNRVFAEATARIIVNDSRATVQAGCGLNDAMQQTALRFCGIIATVRPEMDQLAILNDGRSCGERHLDRGFSKKLRLRAPE